jgi:hypothetical protein
MMKRRALAAPVVFVLGAAAVQASTVIGLSVEDQARLSEMVVVGEVLAMRGVEHPVQGIETAVTLRVTDVLKGDVRRGQSVVFHTRSGQVGPEVSEALGEAVLHPGQRILVFIESVEGRRYNLGLSMGVWDVHEDGAGARLLTRAVQDGLSVVGEAAVEPGPLTMDEMTSRIERAARNPRFDNERLKARFGQGR